ncbi:proline-rich transmembrane protein 1-like [Asterias amurensis]|uniref:proline-rich transmembrane protein 1-like n=1 Tax=Asterias amurensis TaxID=7602 RepID=UPI003AB594C4
MEKQEPPAYDQSGPGVYEPGTTDQPPAYIPPTQPQQYPQQPYPQGQQQAYPPGVQAAYPPGVQPVGVYTAQPPGSTVIVRQPTGPMPNDYLIFAIFVTFCCCLPCGIVAIMKASETKNRWHAGDNEGAVRNSQEAKKWATIALVCGILTYVCTAGFLIVYYLFIFSYLYSY